MSQSRLSAYLRKRKTPYAEGQYSSRDKRPLNSSNNRQERSNSRNEYGDTPLLDAARRADLEQFKRLLEKINEDKIKEMINQRNDKTQDNILHKLFNNLFHYLPNIIQNFIHTLETIIEKIGKENTLKLLTSFNKNGRTPLADAFYFAIEVKKYKSLSIIGVKQILELFPILQDCSLDEENKNLENYIINYKNKYLSLEDLSVVINNNRANNKINEQENKITYLQNKIEKLKSNCELYRSQRNNEKKIAENEKKINLNSIKTNEELSQNIFEEKEKNKKLEQVNKNLQDIAGEKVRELAGKDDEIKLLKSENETHKRKIEELEEKNIKLEQGNKNLQNTIDQSGRELAGKDHEIRWFKDENEARKRKIEELEENNNGLNKSISEEKEKNSILEQVNKNLQDIADEKARELSGKDNEIKLLKGENETRKRKIEELEENNNGLNKSISEEKEKNSILEQVNKNLQDIADEKARELSGKDDEIKLLKGENETRKRKTEELQENNNELNKSISEEKEKNTQFKQANKKLKDTIDKKNKQLANKNKKIAEIVPKLEEHKKVEMELEKQIKNNENLKLEIKKLKLSCEKLQEELNIAEKEKEKLKKIEDIFLPKEKKEEQKFPLQTPAKDPSRVEEEKTNPFQEGKTKIANNRNSFHSSKPPVYKSLNDNFSSDNNGSLKKKAIKKNVTLFNMLPLSYSEFVKPNYTLIDTNSIRETISESDQVDKRKAIGNKGEEYVYISLLNSFCENYKPAEVKSIPNGFELNGFRSKKGKAGEAIKVTVTWHNMNRESHKHYDMEILKQSSAFEKDKHRFVEVKSTIFEKDKDVIFSKDEYEMMEKKGDEYRIYRVYGINKDQPKYKKIVNPYEAILSGDLKSAPCMKLRI